MKRGTLTWTVALVAVVAGCKVKLEKDAVRPDEAVSPAPGASASRGPAFTNLTLALVQTGDETVDREGPRALIAQFRSGFEVPSAADAAGTGADLIGNLETKTSTIGADAVVFSLLKLSNRQGQLVQTFGAKGSSPIRLLSYADAVKLARMIAVATIASQLRESRTLAQLDAAAGNGSTRLTAQGTPPAWPTQATSTGASAAGSSGAQAPPPGPAAQERPPYALPEHPDDFALVVGIEHYENVIGAPTAETDAKAVANYLRALGVPERNLIVLTGDKAGRASIAKYLEAWLPRNVKPTSRVFVYFSGHGAPDPRTGEAFIVPWDGDPKFLAETAYSVTRLEQSLGALPAEKVLVMLDACFSGAGGRSVLPAGARPLLPVRPAGALPSRLTVLSASSAEEITGLSPRGDHGLFTQHLLEGLAGYASEPNGRITVQDLFGYLRPRVQDDARRDNREQTPELLGEHPDAWDLRPPAH